MAPDLNSLPPSNPPRVHSTNGESTSPRSSSVSLAAAATLNAGIQNQESRRSSISSNRNRPSPQSQRAERRRSNVMMNINLNDPSIPGPGELQGDHRASMGHSFSTTSPHSIGGSPTMATGDPHHHQRAPSLGELHQELEQEQEAQVNRLLLMIRQQQAQIQQMQQAGLNPPTSTGAVVDDSTPTSERSLSFPSVPPPVPITVAHPRTRSPANRRSGDLSRESSRRSRGSSGPGGSPAIHPLSAGLHGHADEWLLSGSRDESAFYQAETQMLTRENQMLRMRIRELERQINEANTATANTPATPSNLTAPPLEVEDGSSSLEGPVDVNRGGEDES